MMSVGLAELLVMLVACAVPLAAVVGLVLLLSGTKNKTKLGVNLAPPSQCPKCGAPLPVIRAPKNLRQFMWGGWTCAGCGVELDKWGRIVGD